MSALPLVVWDDHLTCDGCGAEVRVTTDGTRLYALSRNSDGIDSVERVDTELSFYCPHMKNVAVGEWARCAHVLTADLGTEHWSADLALRTLVAEHGTEITVR